MNKIDLVKIVAKAINKDLDRPLELVEKLTYGKLGDISYYTTEEEREMLATKMKIY